MIALAGTETNISKQMKLSERIKKWVFQSTDLVHWDKEAQIRFLVSHST
jgi:hypothetical protein